MAVAVFRLVLAVVGSLMVVASRRSRRFRRQVTRDRRIEISSDDGVSRMYAFHARTRTMSLPSGAQLRPDCALRFSTAAEGLRALLSPAAVAKIVDGVHAGRTRIDGNAALVLWFYSLTRVVLPLGRSRRPRRPVPLPERLSERHLRSAAHITREPVVSELARDWPEAWRARERLLMVRVAGGEIPPPG